MADIEMNSIIKGGKQKETTNLVDKETKEDFCKCCIPENRCLCCFPKRSKCCKFCFLPFLILFSIFLGFLFVPRKVEVVFMQDYFKDIYNDPDNALFTASEISFDFVNSEAVVKGYLPTVTTNYNFMYGVYANAKIEIYYPADQSGGPEPESSTPTGVYLGGLPAAEIRASPKMKCPLLLFGKSCDDNDNKQLYGQYEETKDLKKWMKVGLHEFQASLSLSAGDWGDISSQFLEDCGNCIPPLSLVLGAQCDGETDLLVKVEVEPDEKLMPRASKVMGKIYVDKKVSMACSEFMP